MKHLLISAILIFPLLSIAQEQCEDTLIEHSEESVQFDVSVNDTSLVGIPGAEVKIVRLHMKYDEPAIVLSKYESVTDKRGNATLNPVMPSYWQYSGALEQSGVNNCEQHAGFYAGSYYLVVNKPGFNGFSIEINRLSIATDFKTKAEVKGKVYITLLPMQL